MGMKVRKIGIDFGTSTSVICYQDYNTLYNGELEPIGKCEVLRQGNTAAIPTAIIEANEEMNIYEDLFGMDAQNAAQNPTVRLRTNFKMALFHDSNKELTLKEKTEAISLTEKYFTFLKSLYDEADNLTGEYQIVTYVSFPVRTVFTEADILINAAEKAGFPNVQRMNEAEAALMHAFGRKDSSIRKILAQYTIRDTLNIMMIDMGAGTTDITLYEYRCGSDLKELKELASWPQSGENKTLGGREVDQVLLQYCKNHRLIDDKYCQQTHFDGILLNDCKQWKEQNISPALSRKTTVNSFGPVMARAHNSENYYQDNKLNSTIFELLLNSYMTEFVTAVKDVMQRGELQESQLDFIITVGGHSQWYFIKEILLNNAFTKENNLPQLSFAKIINEPERCIAGVDPQLYVAKGLVVIREEIEWKPISKHEIKLKLVIETRAEPGAAASKFCMAYDLQLLGKDDILPQINNGIKKEMNLAMYTHEQITYTLTVYTIENNIQKTLQTYSGYCPRTLGTTMKSWGKKILGAISDLTWDLADIDLDDIVPSDRINTHLTVSIRYSFDEAENLQMSISLNSPTHWNTTSEISVR